jgi:hypothetical protein
MHDDQDDQGWVRYELMRDDQGRPLRGVRLVHSASANEREKCEMKSVVPTGRVHIKSGGASAIPRERHHDIGSAYHALNKYVALCRQHNKKPGKIAYIYSVDGSDDTLLAYRGDRILASLNACGVDVYIVACKGDELPQRLRRFVSAVAVPGEKWLSDPVAWRKSSLNVMDIPDYVQSDNDDCEWSDYEGEDDATPPEGTTPYDQLAIDLCAPTNMFAWISRSHPTEPRALEVFVVTLALILMGSFQRHVNAPKIRTSIVVEVQVQKLIAEVIGVVLVRVGHGRVV